MKFHALSNFQEPQPLDFFVEGLIPKGFPTLLYGDGGKGKSYLALYLAHCIAMNRRFLGLKVQQGNVLYLDWEMDRDETLRRSYRISRGIGLAQPPSGLFYSPCYEVIDSITDKLEYECRQNNVNFVIYDSFGAASGSSDDYSKEAVQRVYGAAKKVGQTSLFIDHVSKSKPADGHAPMPFGSIYKKNFARSLLYMDFISFDEQEKSMLCSLEQTKNNLSSMFEKRMVKTTFQRDRVVIEHCHYMGS